jgi:hypothetical protein
MNREQRRALALDTMRSNEVDRQMLSHFTSWSMRNPGGFTLSAALSDERLTIIRPHVLAAFQERREHYLELLRDALPDDRLLETSAGVVTDPTTTLTTRDAALISRLPEQLRGSVRVDAAGTYTLPHGDEMLAALKALNIDPATMSSSAPSKFVISRADAKNFAAYRELSERARAAGESVVVVD